MNNATRTTVKITDRTTTAGKAIWVVDGISRVVTVSRFAVRAHVSGLVHYGAWETQSEAARFAHSCPFGAAAFAVEPYHYAGGFGRVEKPSWAA